MKTGNETWKWGLVFVLLAVFLVTANQAYVHITSQEDYPPPDDYLKGDSWDIEHREGPGAGQAMELPPEMQNPELPDALNTQPENTEKLPDLIHEEDIDWNQVPNPASTGE
ncbi:MAG: hypothetical protein Kow0029_13980 [Candidatus Rifleibacteriota bacterium]